jgi:hypothetical protein
VIGSARSLVTETGNMFAITLEALRLMLSSVMWGVTDTVRIAG